MRKTIVTMSFILFCSACLQWQIQASGMVSDMVIMTGTQMAGSLANSLVGGIATELASLVTKENSAMQANMKSFQSQSQAAQQAKLGALMNEFSAAQQNVIAQTSIAETTSNQEINYLSQNMSLDQPQQEYLFDQIVLDQNFSLGTMLTPTGALWKNPFAVGDWEYDGQTDSFFQYQVASLIKQSTDDTGKVTSSSDQAENNAIFTEYYQSSNQYTIAGQIEIYRVEPPFFVGIIFNRARWISGDYESLRKCRMVGLYGKSMTDIGVYFAQQYTMTAAQLKSANSTTPIQTALQQIIQGSVNSQIKISADVFKNIATASVLYNFEIIVTPAKVTINFWQGATKGDPVVIDNLDPAIFLYHGIGFICPGSCARFTLTQPSDLLFSSSARAAYKE